MYFTNRKILPLRIINSFHSMFSDLPTIEYGIFNSLKPIKLFGTGVVPVFADPFIIRTVSWIIKVGVRKIAKAGLDTGNEVSGYQCVNIASIR